MDGFTGFKTAAAAELPDAVAVMDPFHVVRLGADAMDRARRRVQQDTCGRRGRKDDPLYRCRRTLLTGQDLLTDTQRERLDALFADERHQQVKQAWTVYQQMIAAYRNPDPATGRALLQTLIDTAGHGIPTPWSRSGPWPEP